MRHFSFIFPVTKEVKDSNRRGGFCYEHAEDWLINGVCSRRLSFDKNKNSSLYNYKIEQVVYPGTDVSPVVETTEMLNSLEAACFNHVQELFAPNDNHGRIPAHHKIGTLLGKVIPLQRLFRKVK